MELVLVRFILGRFCARERVSWIFFCFSSPEAFYNKPDEVVDTAFLDPGGNDGQAKRDETIHQTDEPLDFRFYDGQAPRQYFSARSRSIPGRRDFSITAVEKKIEFRGFLTAWATPATSLEVAASFSVCSA